MSNGPWGAKRVLAFLINGHQSNGGVFPRPGKWDEQLTGSEKDCAERYRCGAPSIFWLDTALAGLDLLFPLDDEI